MSDKNAKTIKQERIQDADDKKMKKAAMAKKKAEMAKKKAEMTKKAELDKKAELKKKMLIKLDKKNKQSELPTMKL